MLLCSHWFGGLWSAQEVVFCLVFKKKRPSKTTETPHHTPEKKPPTKTNKTSLLLRKYPMEVFEWTYLEVSDFCKTSFL